MKNISFCSIILVLMASCNLNKPLAYYNLSVSAGNTSLVFHGLEQRLERLESGMDLDPVNLAEHVLVRIPYNEKVLGQIEELLGNEESDPMVKSAMAYLKFDIDRAKDLKMTEVFNAVGNVRNFEEAATSLEPLGDYLDGLYDQREKLYLTYDREVTQYAKKNDIEMKFIGQ